MESGSVKIDIGPVLIHYGATSLPSGYGWKSMRCPFKTPKHTDRNASGRVNLELGMYRCLACNVSGDAIKIIREQEGMTFGQALEFTRTIPRANIENVSRSVPSGRKPGKTSRTKWREVLD